MISILFKRVIGSVIGRWALGAVIGLLVSWGAYKWHAFKEDLIHKGQQVCVQEINKQTVIDLRNALAAEKLVAADLRARAAAAADVNQQARERRRALETQVSDLERAMAEQARTDNEYKEWSETPLPTGVADRVRDAAAGRDSDTGN